MPSRVSGYVECGEAQSQLSNLDLIAFAERVGERGDGLTARAIDGNGTMREQIGDAADMVGGVVRGEDRAQLQVLALQILEHGRCIARIDDSGITVVA